MKKIASQIDQSSKDNAKQILYGLIGVFKKRNLYSESHTVYQSALSILKKLLDDHFERYGNFRIHIKRKNILYHDALLYEGEAEPTDLAFLLHRDGILWLEFQNGLEIWEIDTFFNILHDHCVLDEEPEDDIVTALWAVDLPSILYEAADLELGLRDINIADLPCAENKDGDSEKNYGEQRQCETPYYGFATNVLMHDGQDQLWELTASEREQLRKMLAAEEELDGSDYVIDALLYIIEKHCLKEDITELLETLLQELHEALINSRFAYLLKAVAQIKKVIIKNYPQSRWLAPYLKKFLAKLAGKTFLNGLLQIQTHKQKLGATQLKDLKRFLLQLDESVIKTIGPLMLNIHSGELQRIILEVIGTIAMSNFRPLGELISEADSILAGRLVFILGFLKDQRSRRTLSKLLCNPSALVRRPALKAILTRDDQVIDEIFPLIDDSDEEIRNLVFQRLGRERSEHIENKLLNYLNKHGPGLKNGEHFIAVCLTLGRCGTERSIPYLTKLLFKWPLIGVLRSSNSTQRKGAIAALDALSTKKAAWFIDRNNRGFLGNVFRPAISNTP